MTAMTQKTLLKSYFSDIFIVSLIGLLKEGSY